MQTGLAHDRAPVSDRPNWVQPALLTLCLLALWFFCCRFLSSEWRINEQYSYGWFVPFFAAYLFYLRWEDRPEKGESRKGKVETSIAAAITVSALLLLFPLRLFEVGNPDWRPLGWIHTAIAVFLSFALLWRIGGTRWMSHFAFPLAFVFVAVPWISAIEQPIIEGLMRAVAAVAAEALTLCGVPAEVQGNLIRVNNGLVGVNEACSGVRSLQTSLMIGLLFGELKRLSNLRRITLVAAALGVALLANCARAFFLVWVAATQNMSAVGRWHDIAGYAIVGAVFIASFALAALLGRRGSKVKSGKSKVERENALPTSDDIQPLTSFPFQLPPFSFLLSASLWLLLIEVGVEAWYRAHERDLHPEAGWTVQWPEAAPAFRALEIDEDVRSTLRFDQGREAAWKLPAAPETHGVESPTSCFAFFFRWNPGGSSVVRARAHGPEICLPSAGWERIGDHGTAQYQVGPRLSVPFRHIVFRRPRGDRAAHTFFCLQEDQRRPHEARPDLQLPPGTQPDWSLPARTRVVRHGVRNLGQQVFEVVLLTSATASDAAVEHEFGGLIEQLIVPLEPAAR